MATPQPSMGESKTPSKSSEAVLAQRVEAKRRKLEQGDELIEQLKKGDLGGTLFAEVREFITEARGAWAMLDDEMRAKVQLVKDALDIAAEREPEGTEVPSSDPTKPSIPQKGLFRAYSDQLKKEMGT